MKLITSNFAVDSVTSISASSENANFPTSNLKHDFRSKTWRSSGTFIVDSSNNKIDFKDSGGGSELTATLTSGTYSVSGLESEVESQMASVGASTYTCSYSESTGKWTLSSDGAAFELLNSSGTNVGSSLLVNSLGFASTDKTGALSYTGASIAIHTKESVVFDLGSTENITSVALLWPKEDGIRLSSSAVVTVEANATNNWASPAVSQTLTIDNTYEIATYFWNTDQSYRYWRVSLEDPANANLFVDLGVVVLGKSIDIQEPENGFTFGLTDQSKTQRTPFGHEYTDAYPMVSSIEFSYSLMEYGDIQTLENAFRTNGNQTPVFVTFDSDETVFDKDHFALYGKFQKGFGSEHIIYNLFSSDIRIVETV